MNGSRLGDRACVIVGGTGGIGGACARRFRDEGARVVVVGLDHGAEAGGSLATEDFTGHIQGDVSQPVEVGLIFTEALRLLGGRIDVLVHAAGISGRRYGDGPLHECSDDGWDRVMEVNAPRRVLDEPRGREADARAGG